MAPLKKPLKYSKKKKIINSPAISSNSVIKSGSKIGGKCFEKKSFKAVATALTGISNCSISEFGSKKKLN